MIDGCATRTGGCGLLGWGTRRLRRRTAHTSRSRAASVRVLVWGLVTDRPPSRSALALTAWPWSEHTSVTTVWYVPMWNCWYVVSSTGIMPPSGCSSAPTGLYVAGESPSTISTSSG